MSLTGRYQLQAIRDDVILVVEEVYGGNYQWRPANPRDLPALEPEIKDGWRFREERDGTLDPIDGKRYRS